MLKFDCLIQKIELFIKQFILPFGSSRQDFKVEMVKIKNIQQNIAKTEKEEFKKIYVKVWQRILSLMQTEPSLRAHSNYVAILQLIYHLDYFIDKSQQHLCFKRKAGKALDANFFASFFKLKKHSIKDQLSPNFSDCNDFNKYNIIKTFSEDKYAKD